MHVVTLQHELGWVDGCTWLTRLNRTDQIRCPTVQLELKKIYTCKTRNRMKAFIGMELAANASRSIIYETEDCL